MFVDMARDIAEELQSNPEWTIEVADQAGNTVFRLGVVAELLR
jgi:hypothetical protein